MFKRMKGKIKCLFGKHWYRRNDMRKWNLAEECDYIRKFKCGRCGKEIMYSFLRKEIIG